MNPPLCATNKDTTFSVSLGAVHLLSGVLVFLGGFGAAEARTGASISFNSRGCHRYVLGWMRPMVALWSPG